MTSEEITKTKFDILINAIQELSQAKDISFIQQTVKIAARELSGADGATFILKDDSYCYYVDEDAISPLWKGKRFPLNSCISGWTMQNHKTVIIPDIYKDERIPIDAYEPTFVKSLAMVPIRKNNPLGAIGIYWADWYEAGSREVELLESLADSTAIAIENINTHAALKQTINELQQKNDEKKKALNELQTARVAAEKNEEKYRALFNQSMDAVYLHDFDGKIMDVNPMACKQSGYTCEELTNMTVFDAHPSHSNNPTKEEAFKTWTSKDLGQVNFFTIDHQRKDGTIYPVEIATSVVEYGDKKLILSLVRDITERKCKERELQDSYKLLLNLTAQVPGVVYQYRLYPDGSSAFPFSSPGIQTIYEVSPEEVYENASSVFTRIHPEDYDYIVETINESAKNQTAYESEFRVILPKQGLRWRHCHAQPQLLDDGSTLWHGIISDITKQKQYEQEIIRQNQEYEALTEELRQTNEELHETKEIIQESEEKYRALYNNAPLAYQSLNKDGNFVDINPMWSKILGFDKEEVIGKWFGDFLHPDYVEHYRKNFPIFKKQGFVHDVQFKMIKKDKSEIYVSFEGCIGYHSDRTFKQTYCTFKDITEEKKAKEEILLKNKISNSIILSTDDEFYKSVLDVILETLQCKFGYFGYMDYEDEEKLICPTMTYDIWDKCQMPQKTIVFPKQTWAGIWGDSLLHKKTIYKNSELQLPTGHVKLKNALAVPVMFKNKLIGQITVANKEGGFNDSHKIILENICNYLSPLLNAKLREDTFKTQLLSAKERAEAGERALKHSHDLMKYIIEHNRSAVAVHDKNLRYIYVSKRYLDEYKIKDKNILGKHHYDVFPDLPQKWRDVHKKALAGEVSSAEDDPYYKDDGSVEWTRWECRPWYENDNSIGGFIVYTEVVTERKKMELELRASKEKAEESDRLKTEFLHNMSHEIRTPMNGIIGFSEMLDKPDITDEKRKYYSKIIQNSSHQLLRIIDDILAISKLETKQEIISEGQFSLNELLMELFSVFSLKSVNQNIHFYVKKALLDDHSLIISDKTKVHKILSNLLENAFKFTNEGFIELGYTIDKINLVLYVKDTGLGISPENFKIIFERFSQEEKEMSRKYGGLGLGLSISKEHAELLGGSITLESEKGKGSTFYVTIPYKPVQIESERVSMDSS
ncbi:MAG: PAS domain S-box protein, partial [Bacteroidales bacterium]|nr:PAS domain S-box protein [Bacteroidales bacterium]